MRVPRLRLSLFSELLQLAHVEDDLAVRRRDRLALPAFEHVHELRVRTAVDVGPDGLGLLAGEETVRSRLRGVPERGRDRRGEPGELGGKPLLDPLLDVHVRVQLVHEPEREGAPDLLVLEHARAEPDPVVGVENLFLDEDRQRPGEGDHGREGDQHPDEDAPSLRHRGNRHVGVHVCTTLLPRRAPVIT